MEEKKQILIKAYVMYVLVAIVMVTVIGRVINIQYGNVVPDYPSDTLQTGQIPTRMDSVLPMRGRILASDGKDLITSVPLYDLHIDLSVIKDELFKEVDSLALNLARVFPEKSKDQWKTELTVQREKKNQYFKIKNKVGHDVLQEVREFPILREDKYKGGFIEEKYFVRQRPYGSLAARTLGYKREGARPVGLEGSFDEYLMGDFGLIEKQWVNNSWKPMTGDNVKDPVAGADVVTSIDVDIQDVAENELMKMLEKQSAVHGSVVLMEVETGFVKAIANLTKGNDGKYYETFNHAVGTKSDPGSTFKLATLMALLEDGKVDITDIVMAGGKYSAFDHTQYDSNHGHGYGEISIQRAFEVSSNVFCRLVHQSYYETGQSKKFIERIRSFGLVDTLGLDIAGEAIPVIHDVGEEGFSGITLFQMAIGYEVEVAPLQMLAFYNAVANNGELVRPQFVREVRRDGQTIKEFEKVVLKEKICSDQTLAKLRLCLEGVVERGTGKNLQSSNFQIAGKTGTAQLAQSGRGYGDDYQASFVGYFPADKPKYSLSVVIAGPTQDIYGADVSGTVFTAIADRVFASGKEFQEDYNEVNDPIITKPIVKNGRLKETEIALQRMGVSYKSHATDGEYIVASNDETKVNLRSKKDVRNQVPDVIGMSLNDAVFLLENKGLRVKVSGSGKVVSQSQKAGTNVVGGTVIKLVLN